MANLSVVSMAKVPLTGKRTFSLEKLPCPRLMLAFRKVLVEILDEGHWGLCPDLYVSTRLGL
eukprot:scaffold4603_cov175-Amphora_coffeaeformis.AAC.6